MNKMKIQDICKQPSPWASVSWGGLNLLADGYCSMAVIVASAHSISQFSPILEANGETDRFV